MKYPSKNIYTYEVMISCVLDHTEHMSCMVQHMSLFQKSWRLAFSFIEKWLKRVGHAEERRKIGYSKYKVIRQVRNEEKERHADSERCNLELREIHSENMREWKRNALAIHKEDKFVKVYLEIFEYYNYRELVFKRKICAIIFVVRLYLLLWIYLLYI